jgi:hypothetical protein
MINPISARRREDRDEYNARKSAFLKARPKCQRCYKARSKDVHHVHGRLGGAYLNTNTWLAVCRQCHDWIHQHPKEARALGLLR